MEFKRELTSDTTSPNNRAAKKVDTENPCTKTSVSIIRNIFITRVKNPKVNIFMGSVSISKTGFIKTFKTPITTATIKAT